jgi:hypothetical protein
VGRHQTATIEGALADALIERFREDLENEAASSAARIEDDRMYDYDRDYDDSYDY